MERNDSPDAASSRGKGLYELIKRDLKDGGISEDPVRIELSAGTIEYHDRDLQTEKGLIEDADRIVGAIIAISRKQSILCETSDESFFDSCFSKEELEIYNVWLAPLEIKEDCRVSKELIEKEKNISKVFELKKKKSKRRLRKKEREFLAEHASDTLTEEERAQIRKNRKAVESAYNKRVKRIGETAFAKELLRDTIRRFNSRIGGTYFTARYGFTFVNMYLLHRLSLLKKLRFLPREKGPEDEYNYSPQDIRRRD